MILQKQNEKVAFFPLADMDDSGAHPVGAHEEKKDNASGAEEESSAPPATDDPSAFLRGPWELPLSYAVRVFDKV